MGYMAFGRPTTASHVRNLLVASSLEGQDSLLMVLGPLSTDLDGIKLFMQAVIN